MQCPNCQKKILPDSFFCQWCSTYIPDPQSAKKIRGCFSLFIALLLDPLLGLALFLIMLITFGAIFQSTGAVIFLAIFFVFGYSIYRLVMLGRGQTLGKKVLGLRVVNAQTGTIPGFWRMGSLAEIFGCFISGLFLAVGQFRALFDKNGQVWHDKLAGTVAVPESCAASREIIRGFTIVATLIGISTGCIITTVLRSQNNRAQLASASTVRRATFRCDSEPKPICPAHALSGRNSVA